MDEQFDTENDAPVVMDQADLNRRLFAVQAAIDAKYVKDNKEFMDLVHQIEEYLKP